MSELKKRDNEARRCLEEENTVLKKLLRSAEEERDGYRKMLQTWAMARISPEERKRWEQDEPSDGRTILDILAEVRREPR